MTRPNPQQRDRLCGADVYRCTECRNTVAPSKIRNRAGCPKHAGVQVLFDTKENPAFPDDPKYPGGCIREVKQFATSCRYHGGTAPHMEAAADDRRLDAQIERTVRERLGSAAPVENPLRALQALAGEAIEWKLVLREKVSDLGQWRYEDDKGGEQLRSEVVLFERAMDRCEKVLVSMARLNIDERLAAIDERIEQRQLDRLKAGLVRAMMVLPPETVAAFKAALADEVRVLEVSLEE